MTRILALHAHPDDCETLAVGTLARLAALGCAITIATATAGECGAVEASPEATARLRRAEAARAAGLIGADYQCAGLPDLGVFNDDPSRRRITEMVRAAKPDIVITASPIDYHPDHEAVSQLTRDACFAASAPGYRTGDAPPLPAIPHLYFMDPIGGRDREGRRLAPEFFVDVSDVIGLKRAMIAEHASQTDWLLKQHGIGDPVEAMARLSHRRGQESGVAYAEGFRQYRHEPYPRTPKLQELLGAFITAPSPLAGEGGPRSGSDKGSR